MSSFALPQVRFIALCWLTVLPAAEMTCGAESLKVAAVQFGQEATLAENRDKIIRLTGDAAAKGARLVVFPEGALAAPPKMPADAVPAALTQIAEAAKANGVYVVVVAAFTPAGTSRYHNQLHLFNPRGETLLVYDKDSFADQAGDPRVIDIDGAPCSFIICSDRWSRPVESLPPMLGAKVIIECSNNYDTEWLPELQWYWYVSRAIRNTAYVIFANTARENRLAGGVRGHGHTAVIAPDGSLVAAADDERDKIVTADLDLSQATLQMAIRRSEHALFRDWWAMGKAVQAGEEVPPVETPPLVSSNNSVKCGFALMACSSSIEHNVETMRRGIQQAAAERIDLVVFPELALTGDREADIRTADAKQLDAAIESLRHAARQHERTIVFGAPSLVDGRRRNSAYSIGPDGAVLTRYDQIVVSRPELFQGGVSTKAMWFQVNGIWSMVTIGDDVLWNEMGELAALRGARLHCHLSHRRLTREAALLHDQVLATFASFRMLTIAANPLFPDLQADSNISFSLGSCAWDDVEAGNWCAVKTIVGRPWEGVFSTPRLVPGESNPIRNIGCWRKASPHYRSWMLAGAAAMDQELLAQSDNTPDDNRSGDKATSAVRPFDGRTFHGRIAYSADGNHNDPDDWASSPVALAILAQAGLKDRLVHFDYNCILTDNDSRWAQTHADGVLGAVEHYGYDRSLFHDCQKNRDAAIDSIARAIDASSADDPLYFIVAGPMELPFLGIEKSSPDKRQFVHCISHSHWNDGFAKDYTFTHTKRTIIASGVNWVQIPDQNPTLSFSKYGQPAPPEEFQPFFWMRDSVDARLKFLWDRLVVSTRPDCSDAGMAWFLVTGDDVCEVTELRKLLEDGKLPAPPSPRGHIRLEAECFRHLDGYELEYRDDRQASHRINVKLSGTANGQIRTPFLEPYTATSGRYDVDVRFLDEPRQPYRMALHVDGTLVGQRFKSPARGEDWMTESIQGVLICAGDEIGLSVEASDGSAARIDYVQLNYRRPES